MGYPGGNSEVLALLAWAGLDMLYENNVYGRGFKRD